MSTLATLCVGLLLSAKPVGKAYRGPLDGVDVTHQSAGLIARFEGVDRPAAEAALEAVGLKQNARVAFIRTAYGTLAAVTLDAAPVKLGRFTDLALKLSKAPGVAETWAFVAPGARDDSLEGEAWFRFEAGQAKDSARLQYRDEEKYLALVRRGISATEFRAARWPTYPLSVLAKTLKLPGRACLDQPSQLQTVATVRWPDDAGENLSATSLELTGGMAAEIQQLALTQQRSASSVIAEALSLAREAGKLGRRPETAVASFDEGQPQADKAGRRTLLVYLPLDEVDAAQDAGGAEALSVSRVVQYAWRRAHPVADEPKH